MNIYQSQYIDKQQLSPYSMEYFQQLGNKVNQINFQVKHIDHFQQQRQNKFLKSMNDYKKYLLRQMRRYLQKQRKGLQKNSQHCKFRNQWYKQQLKKSWQISISNRPLILRSLARTNILKRDADEWLSGIDDNVLAGTDNQYQQNQVSNRNRSYQGQSLASQAEMKGSKLINKYNQILQQYYHKI